MVRTPNFTKIYLPRTWTEREGGEKKKHKKKKGGGKRDKKINK
jgi:hypothetical protein